MEDNVYDLIILGGGPAGLSAAIYGGRARMKTLLLEKGSIGGRAFSTREIVNYPGVPDTSGPELTEIMKQQALSFGVEIVKDKISSVDFSNELKLLNSRKKKYIGKTIIISTGTSPRVLNIKGEIEFTGAGVAYCATCDAEFFKDQDVYVLGSGDQAIEESIYITKFAKSVHIVVIHEEGVLDCNKIAAEKAYKNNKIHFIWNSTINEICGDDYVNHVVLKNLKTGELTEHKCDGVFMFVGMIPNTGMFDDSIKDSKGWIVTNELMETSISGVYAVGDVRRKYLRQVSTSVADGAIAATAAERYLSEQDSINSIIEKTERCAICFWTPEIAESASMMQTLQREVNDAKLIEIDVTRFKTLANKYHVVLSEEKPVQLLHFINGVVNEL